MEEKKKNITDKQSQSKSASAGIDPFPYYPSEPCVSVHCAGTLLSVSGAVAGSLLVRRRMY